MKERIVYTVFQTVNKQEFFVGVFSEAQYAIDCAETLVDAENEEQDYKLVDYNLWYGKTRKIEILPKILDKLPMRA